MKKGVLLGVVFLSIIFSFYFVSAVSFSGQGAGSVSNPYNITSCSQLQEMKNNLNSNYALGKDINCTNFAFTSVSTFTGNFSGNNFNIYGLKINIDGGNKLGLFGEINTDSRKVSISNVNLVNVFIEGQHDIGGIVGSVSGNGVLIISNCSVRGIVKATYIGSAYSAGGFIGGSSSNVIIRNSYNFADVSSIYGIYAGGFIGAGSLVNITNSYNVGRIRVASWLSQGSYGIGAGGFIGFASGKSFINNSFNTGSVRGDTLFGGIYGDGNNFNIINSFMVQNCTYSNCIGITTNSNISFYQGTDINTKNPFLPWDFTNIWKTCPLNYPIFKWQTCPSVKMCYEDKDQDNYTSGNSMAISLGSNCNINYYEEIHFEDLDVIDCNDNNANAWQSINNLGIINSTNTNYTIPNSCETRCVGNSSVINGNLYYRNDSSNNYIYRNCNPIPPSVCPPTPICNVSQKQCSGSGYQTCFINSTGCAQWNSTVINCDSGLTCGGNGDCRSFGINVLPNISKPFNNALASKTINFSLLTSSVVNCALGICPAGKTCIVYGGLNCSYVHFPQNKTTNPGYNLTVFWNITNLDLNVQSYTDSGDWNRNFSQVVNFSRYFNLFAHYSAIATLVYSSGAIRVNGTSSTIYFDTTTDWSCSRTSSNAWWVNPSPLGQNVSALTNCALHLAEYGSSCCPTENNICRADGRCRGGANYCSELNSSTSCNSASIDIIKNSITSVFGNYNACTRTWYVNSDCTGFNSCGCFWNNLTNSCSVGYQAKKICGNSNFTIGTCSFETAVTGSCSTDNLVTVNSKAFLPAISPDLLDLYFSDCRDSTNSLPCPSTAKLPFASGWSIAIAVLVIVLVYLVLRKFYKKHL